MRKTVALSLLAGVSLGAAAVWAQTVTNSVYSANIVGFVSVVAPATNMVLAGYNFKPTSGTVATLKEVFGTNQLVRNNIHTRATKISVWNTAKGLSGGYDIYYQKLDYDFYDQETGLKNTNAIIRAGDGFWIQNSAKTNLTVQLAGEVILDNTFARLSPLGLMIIGNPYASPLDLNSTNLHWIADGATGNNLYTRADEVSIWNGRGYDMFYLNASGKWLPRAGTMNNPVISIGGAAWYKAKKAFTNTLVRPYPVQ